MNQPLDYLNAAVAIAEAMCDTGSECYENEHLLALPFNGAMMFYVDEMAYFELAAQRAWAEANAQIGCIVNDPRYIEWAKTQQTETA